MKKALLFLIIASMIPATASSEVIGKRKINPIDRTFTITYFSDGKQVAQKTIGQDGNTIKFTGKIPDGIIREYYDDGTLMYESTYKNGALEGPTKGFYQNGALAGEWNYKNDELEGTGKVYFNTGELQYIDTYENGEMVDRKTYDKTGKLVTEKKTGEVKEAPKKTQEKAKEKQGQTK